ncbi:uncharacterized protein EV420DRAFT_1487289 [Desarmillaria tabescens]|uniref:DUF6534 domain-containing protein n=1 Tax=Armillaria tabescens TaxID=1929756 RepID=A0AA39J8F1_ARMTA|nr:uncharacterized protein EV420DRAFT_1487289 [Desarmillaria tabescens]KAK0437111.1 hypothetical protein EV420DRAFT_1487289 [Desarmillaria tabescens]
MTSAVLSHDVYMISDFSQLRDISQTIDGALATAATLDIIIALAMCYYLLKMKLVVIIRFILISGLATTACSLIIPHNRFSFMIPKVYINSLLAMFNGREVKEKQGGSSSDSVPHRTFNVHDEERIINTIPLSNIGLSTQTLDESVHDQSKLELYVHGSE